MAATYSWLRHKNLHADLVLPGTVATVGDGVEATLAVDETDSRGHSVCFTLREAHAEGTWTTQLVAHDPGTTERERSVWVDIDAPAHEHDEHRAKWTAPPRIARNLLEVLHARDGGAVLDLAPVTVVTKLLKQTTGLAATYVLDAEATRQFATKVGDTHAVLPQDLHRVHRPAPTHRQDELTSQGDPCLP